VSHVTALPDYRSL